MNHQRLYEAFNRYTIAYPQLLAGASPLSAEGNQGLVVRFDDNTVMKIAYRHWGDADDAEARDTFPNLKKEYDILAHLNANPRQHVIVPQLKSELIPLAVVDAFKRSSNVTEVARILNVHDKTIAKWIREYSSIKNIAKSWLRKNDTNIS